MEDRTLRIYQGNTLIRQYIEDSPAYPEVCSYLGIPRPGSKVTQDTPDSPKRMTKYAILDKHFKEVRMTSSYQGSENYKLYELNSIDGWLAHLKNYLVPEKDFLQVELRKVQTVVGVCLQGRATSQQWIKTFKLAFSQNGTEFYYVNNEQQFEGNSDNTTIKIIKTPKIRTKFLRLIPTSFNSYKTCRFDVLIQV